MRKKHSDLIRPFKGRGAHDAPSAPDLLASGVDAEASIVPIVLSKTFSLSTHLPGLRPAVASLMLFGATFGVVGQNDSQGNSATLNPVPPVSSIILSNRAKKREAYKTAITAVRSDLKSPATMIEMAIDLARDNDPELRSMALGAFLSVEQYISATERTNWTKLCGKLFRPMLDEIGMTPRSDEAAFVPQYRASLLGSLGLVAADPEVIAYFRKIASELLSSTNVAWGPSEYAPLFITTIHGDAAWAKRVQTAFENSSTPDRRSRLLHLLIGFRNPDLVRAGLDYALKNVVESREFMTLLLSGVLKESATVRFEWLKENYEVVKTRLDQKTLDVVAIDMISAGDAKLFANGEEFLMNPKRRTPVLERIVEARKKEMAPLYARREKSREDLALAIADGLKGPQHETSPSFRNP